MAKNAFERLRALCLALPNTKETMPWGTPHFRVGEKIFCGCSENEKGVWTASFKLEPSHAAVVLHDPRFTVAQYVGRYGWVTMDLSRVKDWDEVDTLVRESYRLIAPKKMAAQLEAQTGGKATKAKTAKSRARPGASEGKSRAKLGRKA